MHDPEIVTPRQYTEREALREAREALDTAQYHAERAVSLCSDMRNVKQVLGHLQQRDTAMTIANAALARV